MKNLAGEAEDWVSGSIIGSDLMPDVFYAGKPTLPMKPLACVNSSTSWVPGNAQDGGKLKSEVKMAYDSEIGDDISRYDELALDHYVSIAEEILSGTDVGGRSVLDAGCGTGVLSLPALEA